MNVNLGDRELSGKGYELKSFISESLTEEDILNSWSQSE